MIRFSITADLTAVKKSISDLKRKKVPQAAARALNKTIRAVRVEANKQIRQERALPASVVRDSLRVSLANKDKLVAAVVASGRPIPLRGYAARETRKGVTVKVSPGGRKLVKHAGNAAFMVAKFGGHVYARTGSARLPMKKLYGPSLPATFIKEKVQSAMDKVAGDTWPKRFAEELRFELNKG